MGYTNGENQIPAELIEKIQEYVDGKTVYIPRKKGKRKPWGEESENRTALEKRNLEIYEKYLSGISVKELSGEYYISPQGIYKILSKFKH